MGAVDRGHNVARDGAGFAALLESDGHVAKVNVLLCDFLARQRLQEREDTEREEGVHLRILRSARTPVKLSVSARRRHPSGTLDPGQGALRGLSK